jgi:hypothetical protein
LGGSHEGRPLDGGAGVHHEASRSHEDRVARAAIYRVIYRKMPSWDGDVSLGRGTIGVG